MPKSPQPKRHFDRFSRFRTVHARSWPTDSSSCTHRPRYNGNKADSTPAVAGWGVTLRETSRSSLDRPLPATGIHMRQAQAACQPRCLSLAATSSSLSLCANMTSSIKPEIRNVSVRRQRRTEPPPYIGNKQKGLVKIRRVVRRYDRGQTNTHRHTHHNTPLPIGEQ